MSDIEENEKEVKELENKLESVRKEFELIMKDKP